MTGTRTSPSEENYLEWIYRFSADGPVRPIYLAEKLGIKPPSVTKAVSSLVKRGLVRREERGALVLTEQGEELGKAVVRRDECLTALLVEILSMPPELADPEVHRLEHFLSEDVLNRLEVLIDFARLSPAWIKRLHLRVNRAARPDDSEGRIMVGQTPIHSGLPHEKGTRAGEPLYPA
jgi:DtxR family manganese transport transcriptional regulator